MLTILDDLTVDDSFSIIDFNQHTRCWKDELRSGTPINVEEAKEYIRKLQPSGGKRAQ